jgi:hypothetical protein
VYLLSDHCGLILFKLARGDLIYWLPGLGWPISIFGRFLVKVITDFTGYAISVFPATGLTTRGLIFAVRCSFIHFRHPLELGGIYFFVNALMNVASWFVAAALYSVYYPAWANALAYGANDSTAESMVNSTYSANFAGANSTGAPPRTLCMQS